MSHLPTVPNPGSNHHQHQRQQVSPPPSPHFPLGPDDRGNWEHRWRRKTTYDAQGKLIGTVIEEESTYTPPHLLQLQSPRMQRDGKGLLWLLVLFLLAPVAFSLIIFLLIVLGLLMAVLQKVLLTMFLVVVGLLMLLLLFRLMGRIPRMP